MTTPTLADLDRARDVALDLSGWGRRFVFYQPRNFAFWGYLALVGIGFLDVLIDARPRVQRLRRRRSGWR